MTLTVGVDIGGTKVAVGVVDAAGQVVDRVRRPIAANDPSTTLAEIIELIAGMVDRHDVSAVGIGVAGLIDAGRGRVNFAANLGWVDVAVREVVEAGTDLPTVLDDDANAAAWGEYRFGAGRDESNLLMITIGTGIGGGVIDNGSLRHGATGSASDVGHLPIVPDGIECSCGARGCLEEYASGRALARAAHDLGASEQSRASAVLSFGDGTLKGIRGEHVTLAASRGDSMALEAFDYITNWLGRGLAVLTAVLDPGCVVLGGGVTEAGEILLTRTRDAYERALPAGEYRSPARLKLAQLGSDAGLIGAADLARIN